MSYITIDEANEILGSDFAPDSDKARLIKLANTWMANEISKEPDVIDPLLKDAACEIIKGIIAGVIYVGIEKPTIREKVKADSVEVEETFTAGSRDISQYEQIAKVYINSLGLKGRGFAFGVYRG